jgi:hypothetical protein
MLACCVHILLLIRSQWLCLILLHAPLFSYFFFLSHPSIQCEIGPAIGFNVAWSIAGNSMHICMSAKTNGTTDWIGIGFSTDAHGLKEKRKEKKRKEVVGVWGFPKNRISEWVQQVMICTGIRSYRADNFFFYFSLSSYFLFF